MITFMVPGLSTPFDIGTKLRAAAHHEAGHLVVAAVMDLALRPEGLMIDPVAEGLACYCKKPEDVDSARERVLTATFAGWYAQKRFCEESSITFAQDLSMTCDWWEAHRILCDMSKAYSAEQNYATAHERLERRAETIVGERWTAVQALASALLAKEWASIKALESGGKWSEQATAKYVLGDDVVNILAGYGIPARCVSAC
jgi:hypothetical protein